MAADPAGGGVPRERLRALAGDEPFVEVEGLHAGYGKLEILHGVDLYVGLGSSLCLIGPNGAGKSTVLHAIFGTARTLRGTMRAGGTDLARLSSHEKLLKARLGYVLQDSSIFPGMTVEENIQMGAYVVPDRQSRIDLTLATLDAHPRLKERAGQKASVLSGGERRLLEIARAMMTDPQVLLIDEPSIGLEPRFIGMVFDLLTRLQERGDVSIILVEQNAKKGLAFADLGYVLAAGRVVRAGSGDELLEDPDVGRLFLGSQPAGQA